MNKLKDKVFGVLVLILTVFTLSILILYNYQNYSEEKGNIEKNLTQLKGDKEKFNDEPKQLNKEMKELPPDDDIKQKIFMDSEVYTVIIDENNNIKDIISHTPDGQIDNKIKEEAIKILNISNTKKTKIGNLYFINYAYSIKDNNFLTIINTSQIKEKLREGLFISLFVFVVLELIIIYVSEKLTEWIIKPAIEALNKQKQFITDASHELKTPISVILASSESLENDFQEKWVVNIKSETERMSRLVTNLLDLSQIENDAEKQIYNKINLSKLVQNSSLTFEGLMFEKNINFKTDIDENINLNCDSDQIKQLIGIILDNAIKHSVENGEIIVSLKNEKNDIVLSIANIGNPLKLGEEEKIFERFYRSDKSRSRKENRYGLGLAIAKAIVLRHNGKISASSSNGYTTFKVIFKNK